MRFSQVLKDERGKKEQKGDCHLTIQKPTRELSIEETLTWTFDLYSNHVVTFFILLLVGSLISGSLGAIISNYARNVFQIDTAFPSDISPSQLWGIILNLLAIVLVSLLITWLIDTVIHGICIKYASGLIEQKKQSLDDAFNFTMHRLVSLLASAIIVAILVVLGLIALVVPGIILIIMLSLTEPAILIEDIGALDSLSRSRRLVSGRWLKTFAFLLIIGIIVVIVSYIGSLIATPFGDFSWVASSIISAFVAPIAPISTTVYYYSMIEKEEQQRIPPPPPPPF